MTVLDLINSELESGHFEGCDFIRKEKVERQNKWLITFWLLQKLQRQTNKQTKKLLECVIIK